MRFLSVLDPRFTLGDESRGEISAWIDRLSPATADALERIQLQRGDAVTVRRSYSGDEPLHAWEAQI